MRGESSTKKLNGHVICINYLGRIAQRYVAHSVVFLLIKSSLANSSSEISTGRKYVPTFIHSSMVSDDGLQDQDKLTRSPHNRLCFGRYRVVIGKSAR